MSYFFPDFAYAPVLTAFLLCTACAILGYFLAFKIKYFDYFAENQLGVGLISTYVFGFLIAFMAAAAWQNNSDADAALQRERIALKKLYFMPVHSEEMRAKTLDCIDRYISLVHDLEWGKYYNAQRMTQIDDLLDSAMQAHFIHGGPNSPAVDFIDEVSKARDTRISLGEKSGFHYVIKWTIIYLLIVVCCFNISIINRGKKKAAVVALVIYTVCNILAISSVALYVHPYKGPRALKPDEIYIRNR
jgi:hypothetical protein